MSGPNRERVATTCLLHGRRRLGADPAWFLRAGMASCAATVIAMRAAKLGIALTALEVTVESDSDLRGILGLDEKVSAGLNPMRTKVRISGDAEPPALRALVEWADAHSPVALHHQERRRVLTLEIEVI